jgi:periplasmic protein TonB
MALKPSHKIVELPRRSRPVRHRPWRAAVAALDARMAGIEGKLDGGRPATQALPVRMHTALVCSLLFHIFIIYGVTVRMPERAFFDQQSTQLEVVLVNAKSKARPVKADALAQHNLDGGGTTDEKRQAQSPLPVLPDQQATTEVNLALRRVEQLEREARQLMTDARSATQVESAQAAPATAPPTPESEVKPMLQATDLMQRSLEIARLEAKIARDWDDIQQRPRRRFVGARTQEYRFARYIEDWRQKVERVGEMNYPQAARDQKMSGSLIVTVAIKADGSVESVDINKPSGNRILDDATRRIVLLAAPYAAFPSDLAREVDVLHIVRTWTFTSADRFVSE